MDGGESDLFYGRSGFGFKAAAGAIIALGDAADGVAVVVPSCNHGAGNRKVLTGS